jgi:hypothetical protein
VGSPRCGATRYSNGLVVSINHTRRWITICPDARNTIQPVVGSDRDLDYSNSGYEIDDMDTISYHILRMVISMSSPMARNVLGAAMQGRQNAASVFENCITLGNGVGSTGVPDCVALYALGKCFALLRQSL